MAPGAMKWVPVNKPEESTRTEQPGQLEKPEDVLSRPKGDAKGAGKAESKGTSKSGSRGGGKSKGEAKGEGKGTTKGEAKGEAKEKSKGEARGGQKQEQRGEARGETRGGGKAGVGGKGKAKAAGKGKGSRRGFEENPSAPASGVKTVQEVEAEMKNQAGRPLRRPRGGDAIGKQPLEAKGMHCVVRKHSGMGCAVVTMESGAMREVVMVHVERRNPRAAGESQPKMEIGSVVVQLRRHTDKSTQQEVVTDIFVAWGHRAEKESPLAVDAIAEEFDKLYEEAQQGPPAPPAAQPPPVTPVPGQAGATLSTTPQQLFAGRPPTVPPPPMHLPTVGQSGVPAPQAPMHQAYYDYAQRAAMLNPWMVNPTMNQYYQPQANQQAANPMYTHQQAAAAQLHQQMMMQQQLQMQQMQQQQQMQQHVQQQLMQQQLQQQLRPQQPQPQQLQPPQPLQALQPQQQPQQPQPPSPQMPQTPQQSQPHQPLQPPQQPQQVPQVLQTQPPPQPPQADAGASLTATEPPSGPPAMPEAAAAGVVGVGTLPTTPSRSGAVADGQSPEVAPDYAPAKPRLLPIVDPNSGQSINTLQMNFEPRKPSSPLKIINPSSGEAVTP